MHARRSRVVEAVPAELPRDDHVDVVAEHQRLEERRVGPRRRDRPGTVAVGRGIRDDNRPLVGAARARLPLEPQQAAQLIFDVPSWPSLKDTMMGSIDEHFLQTYISKPNISSGLGIICKRN